MHWSYINPHRGFVDPCFSLEHVFFFFLIDLSKQHFPGHNCGPREYFGGIAMLLNSFFIFVYSFIKMLIILIIAHGRLKRFKNNGQLSSSSTWKSRKYSKLRKEHSELRKTMVPKIKENKNSRIKKNGPK